MNRFFRSALFPLVVIVLLVWVASQTLIPHSKSAEKTTYSQFITRAENGDVANVDINPSKRSITGTFPSDGDKKFTVHYPADQSIPFITDTLQSHDVKFDSKGTGGFSWVSAFFSLLPFIILIAFWIFLMNQVQGGP